MGCPGYWGLTELQCPILRGTEPGLPMGDARLTPCSGDGRRWGWALSEWFSLGCDDWRPYINVTALVFWARVISVSFMA